MRPCITRWFKRISTRCFPALHHQTSHHNAGPSQSQCRLSCPSSNPLPADSSTASGLATPSSSSAALPLPRSRPPPFPSTLQTAVKRRPRPSAPPRRPRPCAPNTPKSAATASSRWPGRCRKSYTARSIPGWRGRGSGHAPADGGRAWDILRACPSKTTLDGRDMDLVGQRPPTGEPAFRHGRNRPKTVWAGPKPIRGHGLHRYFFQVVGVRDVQWGNGATEAEPLTKEELVKLVQGKVVGWVGTFERR